jgi:GTP-dependent phosphoenolpyruvate carboxykinase
MLQLPQIKQHYAEFGDKLPRQLRAQLEELEQRLSNGAAEQAST